MNFHCDMIRKAENNFEIWKGWVFIWITEKTEMIIPIIQNMIT